MKSEFHPELTIRGVDSINEGTDEAKAIFELTSNVAVDKITVNYTPRGVNSQEVGFVLNPGTPVDQEVTFLR